MICCFVVSNSLNGLAISYTGSWPSRRAICPRRHRQLTSPSKRPISAPNVSDLRPFSAVISPSANCQTSICIRTDKNNNTISYYECRHFIVNLTGQVRRNATHEFVMGLITGSWSSLLQFI